MVAALLASAPMWAQSGNATVTGQVADGSGAVIPGAIVTIQNNSTNVVQTARTNSEGRYAVSGLIPGTYTIVAEVSGFKKLERTGVGLQVEDRVVIDFSMQVGNAAESITVNSEIPLLRTEDAQAGLVIDSRRILQLPQYDRNPLAFAQLSA